MSDDEKKELPGPNDDPAKGDGFGSVEDGQLAEAAGIAERAGEEIVHKYPSLPVRQRRKVITALRRKLVPPGKPGRKRSAAITAAYADWKAGMRRMDLYRKHIPGFDRMGYWTRKGKMTALMDAIRTRKRREQPRQTPAPERVVDQS